MKAPQPYDEFTIVRQFNRRMVHGMDPVFNHTYPGLVYFAQNIINDQHAAQDIVQECFIRVWEKDIAFDSLSHLKSYLYTAVRNQCTDWLRKEKRNLMTFHNSEQDNGKTEHSALHAMIEAETLQQVYLALNSLPLQCRRIFELLYIHGKTAKEAAEILDLSISTIKTQKARGIKILQEKLPQLISLLFLLDSLNYPGSV